MLPPAPSPPFSESTNQQIETLRTAGWHINEIAWENWKERTLRFNAKNGALSIYLGLPRR